MRADGEICCSGNRRVAQSSWIDSLSCIILFRFIVRFDKYSVRRSARESILQLKIAGFGSKTNDDDVVVEKDEGGES